MLALIVITNSYNEAKSKYKLVTSILGCIVAIYAKQVLFYTSGNAQILKVKICVTGGNNKDL